MADNSKQTISCEPKDYHWQCGTCSGKIYINKEAMILCDKSGCLNTFIA